MRVLQHTSVAQAVSWCTQGGFAVLDQGLFAGTNFLLNVVLARCLEPAEYGIFALAYSIFICLATLHTALFTDPMLIFGSGKYAQGFPHYLRLLLYGHWGMTGAMAFLVGSVAGFCWWYQAVVWAQVLGAIALALPCISLQWLVRRAFYVRSQPHWSALGGLLYLGLMLAGLQGVYWLNALSPASALVVMSGASLIVGGVLAACLCTSQQGSAPEYRFTQIAADHWQYGKWASITIASTWVSRELSYPLLPVWVGLEGSAAVRALMNLVMPMLHVNGALAILLVPRCVEVLRTEGKEGLERCAFQACLLLTGIAGLYWVGLWMCRHTLLLWLYDGRYDAYADVLLLAGLLPLSEAVSSMLSLVLRVLERPDMVFWCHLVALGVTLTVGLWLLATQGVAGAMLGRLAASLAVGGTLLWFRMVPAPALLMVRRGSALNGERP